MIVQPMDKHRFTAPVSVKTYRKLGPFDTTSLPAGLLREHRTKQGTWARLSVQSGEIGFIWDDRESEQDTVILGPGDSIDVRRVSLIISWLNEETLTSRSNSLPSQSDVGFLAPHTSLSRAENGRAKRPIMPIWIMAVRNRIVSGLSAPNA